MHVGIDETGKELMTDGVNDELPVEARSQLGDDAVLKSNIDGLKASRVSIEHIAARDDGPHRPTPRSSIVTIASMTSGLRPLGSSDSMRARAADMMRS